MSKEIIVRFNALSKRMEDLPKMAGVALAVAVAQRLMEHYLLQPENRRSSFVAHWADMMPLVLRMVTDPSAGLKQTLRKHLKEYTNEYLAQEPPDFGQPEHEETAAFACISAIEAYCDDSRGVVRAASQLLAHAQRQAQNASTQMGENLMSESAQARVLRFRHLELDRVESAVSLLEREEFSAEILPQLRTLLTGGGEPR